MPNKLAPTLFFSLLIMTISALLIAWVMPGYLNSWIPNFTPKNLPSEFNDESQKQMADLEPGRYLNLPVIFNAKQ